MLRYHKYLNVSKRYKFCKLKLLKYLRETQVSKRTLINESKFKKYISESEMLRKENKYLKDTAKKVSEKYKPPTYTHSIVCR